MTPQDVLDLPVRNDQEMVPFGAFTSVEWTAATTIFRSPAPACSTGEAMAEIERLALQLPEGFGCEWTGISYDEK